MTIEKKLIKAVNSGNIDKIDESFSLIYDEYNKLIYLVISQYIKNREDILEIRNDVFLNFYNNVNKIDLNRNIKFYLTVSAKNTSLNFLEKRKREKTHCVDNLEHLIEEKRDSTFDDLIIDMRKHLTEEEIEIILSYVVYEEKFKEIAERKNKPVNTIITSYHRAIKRFKKGMTKKE